MALLRILDITDPAGQMAAEAAIRATDPQASIAPDWALGVVEVEGPLPVETLCATLRRAGFKVERLMQRPRTVGTYDIVVLALQSLGFAALGGVGGTILGGMLGALYVRVDPSCESVTDGGSCTTIVLAVAIGAAVIGAVVTAAATAIIGGLRLSHIHRTGEDVPFLRL